MAGSKPIEPGCMVLITGSRTGDSPNVGKMGTAIRQAVQEDNVVETALGAWFVEGAGLCFHWTTGSTSEWKAEDRCLVASKHLLRIDPEADPLDVTHEEPIGALHGR